jgi:hypothetical protein
MAQLGHEDPKMTLGVYTKVIAGRYFNGRCGGDQPRRCTRSGWGADP